MSINNYFHVDAASSGGGNGSSWSLSGANAAFTEAEFETFLEGTVSAGDVIFVKDGTYTLDSAIDSNLRDGTNLSPISIIGVKSSTTNVGANVTYSDWARSAADRPHFEVSTYGFKVGDYYNIRNISFRGSEAYCLTCGNYCTVENCKVENTATGASRFAGSFGSYNRVINNEFTSSGVAGPTTTSYSLIMYNYIHDCYNSTYGIGVRLNGNIITVINNIIDTCYRGLEIFGSDRYSIYASNNTIYGCNIAISGGVGKSSVFMNNIIDSSSAVGFNWTTQYDDNLFWGNHGDDARNVDMWNNVATTTIYQDYLVTSGNPLFTSPVSGNFTFPSNSPCYGTAEDIQLGIG